ncbi:MAG: radical SAM family heme chaperone HemW [Chitinispirillales bacterium]|nr:radical SAM family heme chaperone HemW [Chitinispirillales bacterium]
MTNLSLYIHIPFCLQKCRYCDFYSVPGGDPLVISRYIDAIGREWGIYEDSGVLGNAAINTVYVGGGTPSALDLDMWGRLEEALFSRINKSTIREWSVECNPESFTIEKGRMYAKSGATRLTFGVQSLNARELSVCGRAHSAEKAIEALGDERLDGLFDSIGADIIYALPGQTADTLDNTLSAILSIPRVKHLSAYELTVADGTPFGRHKKMLPLPSEESAAEMYELIGNRCTERGMGQYEVSNYALAGFESIHNRAYWSHKPYIGLGASAHSYIHPKRWSNAAGIERYISAVSTGTLINNAVDFEETLTPLELSREIIFLGLRGIDGIDEDDFAARTGISFCPEGRKEILRGYVGSGLLKNSDKKWTPTPRGMLFADMMARELML